MPPLTEGAFFWLKPKLSDFSNEIDPEKLMSDTSFVCDQYCINVTIECNDTQSPYLDNSIAFIRFEGQSLALYFLTIAQFRLKYNQVIHPFFTQFKVFEGWC